MLPTYPNININWLKRKLSGSRYVEALVKAGIDREKLFSNLGVFVFVLGLGANDHWGGKKVIPANVARSGRDNLRRHVSRVRRVTGEIRGHLENPALRPFESQKPALVEAVKQMQADPAVDALVRISELPALLDTYVLLFKRLLLSSGARRSRLSQQRKFENSSILIFSNYVHSMTGRRMHVAVAGVCTQIMSLAQSNRVLGADDLKALLHRYLDLSQNRNPYRAGPRDSITTRRKCQ